MSLEPSPAPAVGLIISDVSNPFFAEIIPAIEESLDAAGFITMPGNASEDCTKEARLLKTMRSNRRSNLSLLRPGPVRRPTPQTDGTTPDGRLQAPRWRHRLRRGKQRLRRRTEVQPGIGSEPLDRIACASRPFRAKRYFPLTQGKLWARLSCPSGRALESSGRAKHVRRFTYGIAEARE
jgi:hypothetical protein